MKQGILLKMEAVLRDEVGYFLNLGPDRIDINALVGKPVSFDYRGTIHCIRCGRVTKKSFAQGYCYPCFKTAPETSECVLRPELCRAHEGISRDMQWSEQHCLQDHYVYLALSSGLKVGVTRSSQIPTRWIDQGARKAIRLAMTPNRYLAGRIEVALKAHFSDKTNWRNMLTNNIEENVDMAAEKEKAAGFLDTELSKYVIPDEQETEINYPVLQYPEKVKSIDFDKTKYLDAVLVGIKGQYLIFEDGIVLNIRKHSGYLVAMDFSS